MRRARSSVACRASAGARKDASHHCATPTWNSPFPTVQGDLMRTTSEERRLGRVGPTLFCGRGWCTAPWRESLHRAPPPPERSSGCRGTWQVYRAAHRAGLASRSGVQRPRPPAAMVVDPPFLQASRVERESLRRPSEARIYARGPIDSVCVFRPPSKDLLIYRCDCKQQTMAAADVPATCRPAPPHPAGGLCARATTRMLNATLQG